MRTTRWETQILAGIDEIVQCAISAGLKEGELREEEIERGAAIIRGMGDLLLEALEGREEHLKSLIEQLAAQRLPDRRVLQSFGHFSRDLQEIIDRGVEGYLRSKIAKETGASPEDGACPTATEAEQEGPEGARGEEKPSPAHTPSPAEEAGRKASPAGLRGLRLALEQAFPGEEIVENFPLRGGKLAYFMPRLNLGFELASRASDWRKDFFFQRSGIEIVRVKEEELVNPLALIRRLRRKALISETGR